MELVSSIINASLSLYIFTDEATIFQVRDFFLRQIVNDDLFRQFSGIWEMNYCLIEE